MANYDAYGAPRIFLELREAGEPCSKHRVARIMKANDLKARHGYRAPRYTRSPASLLTPDTLQRGFTVPRPNTAGLPILHTCAPGKAGSIWSS